MRLIQWIGFLYALTAYALSLQSTPTASDAARASAAQANLPFYTVCLADINTNMPAYSSYMVDNNRQLPPAVANYYFHAVTLASTADLEADIANSFPFTEFQTFITQFPWYDSLKQKASVSTVYLPQDFMTSSIPTSGRQTTVTAATTTGQTASSDNHSATENKAVSINPSLFALILAVFGAFLA
ncbi:hypothetical protein HG536_0A03300 [Torulaspora globosa]|uniref:Uncharacterized protein n=1 Tax=Torulaspora globosa TaxID=48254 RepID=A0A7G3ZAH6_9SACH|nr:uncharacterized protein HG536_0A03300 [Torulaspora globosa]QLL30512.1 hypothetical protein HG536_0A03300 [Torulaspora globosa]